MTKKQQLKTNKNKHYSVRYFLSFYFSFFSVLVFLIFIWMAQVCVSYHVLESTEALVMDRVSVSSFALMLRFPQCSTSRVH